MVNRRDGERKFEWKLRLCLGKLNKEHDLDWSEIIDIVGLDCSADHLRKVSYGFKEYNDYLKNDGVKTRILSISDLHVPFQLPITTFEKYVGKVDILQLNGDIVDMQSISKFPKSYRVSPMEEIIECRQYIIDLIDFIKPKKVVVNYGNHEERFGAYLAKRLDNELQELMPNTALDLIFDDGFKHYDKLARTKVEYKPLKDVFDDVEIEYTGSWHCQIGQTIFCHPKAFSSALMGTAKKAMDYFRNEGKTFSSLVMAHTHRTGEYTIGNTTIYEQGTCSDTSKMSYMDGRLTFSQKQGFMYICQDENGKILRDKTDLIVLN